jgi:Reverse transcriptase (RNA-dependent DNA polymerase)
MRREAAVYAVYVSENNKNEAALIVMGTQNLNHIRRLLIVQINMEHKQVWEITPKSSIQTRQKIIGSRWVLARKDDGCYRARCIAKGFSQIPGKDFQENHSPVTSDTTLHLLMVIKTIFKLEAGQFDI